MEAVNGPASRIAVYNKEFKFEHGGLVAGYFRTIDGTICNSICWVFTNGTVRALDTAFAGATEVGVRRVHTAAFQHDRPGTVNAMIHSATKSYTYFGGLFDLAGNTSVANIARYNHVSRTWHDVAGGVDGTITSMVEFGEFIIVAGAFSKAGDLTVNNVARFNTVTQKWMAMNFGLDGSVAKLLWWKGQILAVGTFNTGSGSQSKGQFLKGVAVWNGKRWAGLTITLYQQIFDDAFCSASLQTCSTTLLSPVITSAYVAMDSTLWFTTNAGSNNVVSYDGAWNKWLSLPANAGRADAVIIGDDGYPLFLFGGEWRSYDTWNDQLVASKWYANTAMHIME